MLNLLDRLGVQTWSLRAERDTRTLVRRIAACGYRTVELCGAHADFEDPGRIDETAQIFREAGLRIDSIGCQGFNNDARRERAWFECARRCGARLIGADFNPTNAGEAMATATGLAREYGIHVGIHNHGARHWLGSAQMLGHVLATTGPEIGLLLDTAWMIDAGEDPVQVARRFSSRLYGLHIKDFTYDTRRQIHEVVVGDGMLAVGGLVALLEEIDYQGTAVIEYEVDGAGLDAALAQSHARVIQAASPRVAAAAIHR